MTSRVAPTAFMMASTRSPSPRPRAARNRSTARSCSTSRRATAANFSTAWLVDQAGHGLPDLLPRPGGQQRRAGAAPPAESRIEPPPGPGAGSRRLAQLAHPAAHPPGIQLLGQAALHPGAGAGGQPGEHALRLTPRRQGAGRPSPGVQVAVQVERRRGGAPAGHRGRVLQVAWLQVQARHRSRPHPRRPLLARRRQHPLHRAAVAPGDGLAHQVHGVVAAQGEGRLLDGSRHLLLLQAGQQLLLEPGAHLGRQPPQQPGGLRVATAAPRRHRRTGRWPPPPDAPPPPAGPSARPRAAPPGSPPPARAGRRADARGPPRPGPRRGPPAGRPTPAPPRHLPRRARTDR